MPWTASPIGTPSSTESLALCNCSTCPNAAETIVPDGVPGALADRAQRGVALESAGLDHDSAVRRRRRNERLGRGSKVARAGFHPDRAAASEQRNGVGLLDQARGLAGEIVALEPGQLKGILWVVNRHAHERFRALAYQACVPAEDEHDRPPRMCEELVDVGALQRDHEISVTTPSARPRLRASSIPSRRRGARPRIKYGRGGRRWTMTVKAVLRAGNEIGRKPQSDIVCDNSCRAQLCVAQSAHAGVPLLLAGDVIRDASEGAASDHDFAGCDFGQGIGRIDAVVLDVRPRGIDIDDDRRARRAHGELQPMGGWGGAAAAGAVVKQRVPNLDRDSRLVGSLRGADLKAFDGADLLPQNRPAV